MKAHKAARDVRAQAQEAMKIIEAVYAAHPLPEDPSLIEGLRRVADALASIAPALTKARADSFKVASEYLTANGARVGKQVAVDSASQTIRVAKRRGR
jgi:hypothetical protein